MKQQGENSDYGGIKELRLLEAGLPKYNSHTISKLFSCFKTSNFDDTSVVEFGAGSGALADIVRGRFNLNPVCIEIDPTLISELEEKKYVVYRELSKLPSKVKFIYSSNVLEHIEDDRLALSQLSKQLEEDGSLGLYLPAFRLLYSSLDSEIGHFRRYSKRDITEKIENAGFFITKIEYVDSLGFFVALVFKLLDKFGVQLELSSNRLKLFDYVVFPVSKFLDRMGMRKVLGKNILVIAKK